MAVFVSRFASLVAIAAVLALGTRADALNITGLSIAMGGSNTADSTVNGQNSRQTTSAVSIPLSPVAAADTLNSYTEFTTRYAMLIAADRTNTSGSTTTNMVVSYSITFTVDNPTGASLQIDIDTLRVGALTSISDSAGNSTITLGAASGTLAIDGGAAVTQAGLGALAVTQTAPTGTSNANTPFNQAGTTLTILTSALTSTYVLQFDFDPTSVLSAHDGAAIRMGLQGGITSTTADDYPGATFPRDATQQSNDGHFIDVRATIIAAVPEPETAGLLAFGVLLLALRRARTRR